MTGSTTRISKLGYGEIEQFLRDLTEEGLGGHHIREFKMDKPAFRQWVQNGLAILSERWTTLPIHTPRKEWTQIEGFNVWTHRRLNDTRITEEDGAELLEIWVSTVPTPGHSRVGELVNLHPRKWRSVHGALMRRYGSNDVEIRVPTSSPSVGDKTDSWGPEWRAQLGQGVFVSLGNGVKASVVGKDDKHDCYLGVAGYKMVLLFESASFDSPWPMCMHVKEPKWREVTDDVQIRPHETTPNAIWVRNRKH